MMLELVYSILGILGVSEVFISYKKRSDKGTRKFGKDRLSLIAIWITMMLSVFFAIKFREAAGPFVPITIATVAGVLVSVLGSVLRWTAIYQLKEAFTVDVSIISGHNLKMDGLFRRVRHPSYTGLLMNYVGAGIALNSLNSLLALSIPIFIVIHYRMKVEETLLMAEFGKEYRSYMEATKRIIPFIY